MKHYDYYGNHTTQAVLDTVKAVRRQCKTRNQCIAAAAAFAAAGHTADALADAYDETDWVTSEHFAHIADSCYNLRFDAHRAARRK